LLSLNVWLTSLLASIRISRHEFAVTSVQWYPFDTGMFVSSSTDCTVKVWDTNTLKAELEFKFDEIVNACGMSPISGTHSLIAGVRLPSV
jgi:DNA excision repair protein ERCC-8